MIYINELCRSILRERYNISDRELEVVSLILRGYSNEQIGDVLCISLPTVKGHIQNIFGKIDVSNSTQLCHRVNAIIVQNLEVSHLSEESA